VAKCAHYLVSLFRGDSITVDSADILEMVFIARQLENDELLSHFVCEESITVKNAVGRLLFSCEDSEVKFACANFCCLDLSSITVEDWLFQVVRKFNF
jgi:hypothetical protein